MREMQSYGRVVLTKHTKMASHIIQLHNGVFEHFPFLLWRGTPSLLHGLGRSLKFVTRIRGGATEFIPAKS